MPCPITSVLGAGAAFGGAHTLFVQDRPGRLIAWSALVALVAAWSAYFALLRDPWLRVGLEALSMMALGAGFWRVRWLARHRGVHSPLMSATLAATRRVWAVIGSPAVLSAKVWLAAMLVTEWRGKAHFAPLEYLAVSALIVALIGHRVVAARRAPRFAALESFADGDPVARCPLGFGCAAAPAAAHPSLPEASARGRTGSRALEPAGWS